MQGTSAIPRGNDVLRDLQFGCTGWSPAADGRASGSQRTGRKEKSHQDNGKKPQCAKSHRNHFCPSEKKAIKGCTARIVPTPSAFRKRNRFGLQTYEAARTLGVPEPLSLTVRYDALNAMLQLNQFLKEHRKVEELEATVAGLAATVKEQSAQIQKVSAQLEASRPRCKRPRLRAHHSLKPRTCSCVQEIQSCVPEQNPASTCSL